MSGVARTQYALVTAAYNEEAHLEELIASVIAQTLRPVKWVIVSDGSTDRTDEIITGFAREHDFIVLHRITEEHPRNFAAQVHAINRGFSLLGGVPYEFIGNLDADISMDREYFSKLIGEFGRNPQLGLAGGFIYENAGAGFTPRRTNRERSVPHAVQLFRRGCFEELGGYVALPYGGPDWHAEVRVRMNGWTVESFPHLPVYHHRPTGTAGGLLRYWYRQGSMDYALGSHPLFEGVKMMRRLGSRPYVLGALARLTGYLSATLRRDARPVSAEFVQFLQNEQMNRLKRLLPGA